MKCNKKNFKKYQNCIYSKVNENKILEYIYMFLKNQYINIY